MSILSENGPYHLDFSLKRELKRSTLSPFSCGMLLTRLVKYVMSESSELSNDRYVLYDHVMYPLTAQQERKTRKDYDTRRVRSSTSSSSAFGQPSSSHPNDDDNDRNDERTSRANDTTTPSPITKSSSPSPPNAPSKTPSTKDTSSTFGTTSSLFESKPQSSPLSSNDTPSPQPSSHFLNDIMNAPPRPSNLIPPQSHPSLDITLSISPQTPLDHLFESPSPPPQPPIMCHPIYFNILDYHGAHCICCFHNHNLILSLRDEMHFMFSHLEYLLTFAIASRSLPHP
ncbi:hypothetical protein Tco_0097222 [Tanacetum coccineum]